MKYLNEIGNKTEGHLVINNKPSTTHVLQKEKFGHLSEAAYGPSSASNKATVVQKGLLLRLSLSETNVRRFTHCCWSKNSSQLLCCDHIGSVYLLDLVTSRWSLVNNVNSASTALCYNLKRNSSEYLIATADSPIIKCYSVDNRSLVGSLKGHKFPAFQITVRQKPGTANQASHHLLGTFLGHRVKNFGWQN